MIGEEYPLLWANSVTIVQSMATGEWLHFSPHLSPCSLLCTNCQTLCGGPSSKVGSTTYDHGPNLTYLLFL